MTSGPATPADRFAGGFAWLRGLGLQRSTNRWLGGVCAGLAHRTGLDPLVVRGAAIAIALMLNGLFVLPYLAGWLLLPDSAGRIRAEEALRRADPGGIALGAAVGLALVGTVAGLVRDTGGIRIGPLVVVGAIGWWVVRGLRTPHRHGAQPLPPAPPTSPPGAWPAQTPAPAPSAPAPVQDAPSWPTHQARPAPAGLGPGRTYAPAAPAAPAAVEPQVRTRRLSGGLPLFAVALGCAITAYGLMSAHAAQALWPKPHAAGAFAAVAAACFVLVVAGLNGRRAGGTAWLTALALVGALATGALPSNLRDAATVGEVTWHPRPGETGQYSLGMGQGDLDLSLIGPEVDRQEIAISIGMGELVVIVPDTLTVEVVGSAGLGAVSTASVVDGPTSPVTEGVGVSGTIRVGTGEPDVVVRASAGMGEIVVVSTPGRAITPAARPARTPSGTPAPVPTSSGSPT